jgi:hypothetical protein
MLSIDQNCTPLWDTVPKLHALARHGHQVLQCIEDVDVAFTAMGDDANAPIRLARERFYASGGADWGAALFYHEFLGRVPVEPREWEPLTGLKTAQLARQLGTSVEEVFNRYSPSDNWQLIGPSYAGDRDYHRTIGDLTGGEASPFIAQLLDRMASDFQARLPDQGARQRGREWLDRQRELADSIGAQCRVLPLGDLYAEWMSQLSLPRVGLAMASDHFSIHSDGIWLLELFTRNYDKAAPLYNQALAETNVGLNPLDIDAGELPFFVVLDRDERQLRTGVRLERGDLVFGEHRVALEADGQFPLGPMIAHGVIALAGKAVLLTLQVRTGPSAQPLALPYKGSSYVPASHRLQQLLQNAGLLQGEVQPIVRVRLGLLDRLSQLDTPIALPEHLAAAIGKDVVPASTLGRQWRELMSDARARLEAFRTDTGREGWLEANTPDIGEQVAQLEQRRRELARENPKSAELRELGQQQKQLQRQRLARLVEQIDRDWQIAQLDYWDTRGASWPWALALGGEDFYNSVLDRAEIYPETPESTPQP